MPLLGRGVGGGLTRARRMLRVVKDKHISGGGLCCYDKRVLGHVASSKKNEEMITEFRNAYHPTCSLHPRDLSLCLSQSFHSLTQSLHTLLQEKIVSAVTVVLFIHIPYLLCHCHSDWHPPGHHRWVASHWLSPNGSVHLICTH